MEKKTIFLMGGFGNVMFQLNAAWNMVDIGYEVQYNFTMLRNNLITKVLGWSVHGTEKELEILGIKEDRYLFSYLSVLMLWLSKKINRKILFCEYTNQITDIKKNTKFIAGYFQNKSYINQRFVDYLKQKISEICLNIEKDSANYDLVVHFRAGDYKKYGLIILDEKFYSHIMAKYKKILVVTNDIEAAKNIFINVMLLKNIEIHKSKEPMEDFMILQGAKNLVIANSTFSWWAAELSKAEKIYEPEFFFEDTEWKPKSLKNRIKISI